MTVLSGWVGTLGSEGSERNREGCRGVGSGQIHDEDIREVDSAPHGVEDRIADTLR